MIASHTNANLGAPRHRVKTTEDVMTSEDMARFLREFDPRRDAMLRRLHKAAGVNKAKPMNLADLEALAAAAAELLTNTLANMPEPRRGEVVQGLSETLAADVARKREWLEQRLPIRRFDEPKDSA
jgi:hypothetical protein